MEDMRRYQIPAFGNWDYCDELPITQYFESARQAGLIRGVPFFEEDVDLFKVPVPTTPVYHYYPQHDRKAARKSARVGGVREKQQQGKGQPKKQGRVCDVIAQTPRRPKAVDEDLYKIPPELLYQKPKRKRLLMGFWTGCLGLNCIR